MFYYLSKIAWFFATPSNLLPSLILVGLALMLTRLRRTGFALAVFGGVGLFAAGLSPLANWIIGPLQDRFPIFQDDGRPVAGIIVLGGVVEAEESIGRGQLATNEAAERVIAMADLARRYPEAQILFSGGGSTLLLDETPEAAALGQFVGTLGVAKDRLVFEDRSRTTYENAIFSRELAAPKPGERWLLVTSAWHMPRSIGCFRAVGLDLEAYPVDFRTEGDTTDYWRPFDSFLESLGVASLAIKEWLGLVVYRLA